MSCEKSNLIHAYHDGMLSAGDRSAVEAHLRSCSECSALLNDLRNLSRLIVSAQTTEASPQIMRRLRTAHYILPDRGVLKIASWLTSAAAAILLAALPLWRPQPTSMPNNPSADVALDAAVTPPSEADSAGHNDLVALAEWMSDDLSTGDRR